MLPGTGFGNDALFAQALGQQYLPYGVINFVRSGMVQILPFQEDIGNRIFQSSA
jgi:hypothetical protein